jgi:hypothetical protein
LLTAAPPSDRVGGSAEQWMCIGVKMPRERHSHGMCPMLPWSHRVFTTS